MSWAAEAFKGIDLENKRLDKRTVLLAERLAEKPTARIPGVPAGLGRSGLSLSWPRGH